MSRKMSIFPNALTVGNMFFGFWSIVSSIDGDYRKACLFIMLGGVCDALDGKVARLVKGTSDFGVEFDSLSDLITFGAAPSIMLLMLYKNHFSPISPEYQDLSFLYYIFAFMPLLFTGIRLARFNAELIGHDKESFSGLPSPASALTIISFVLFEYAWFGAVIHYKYLILVSLGVSYLMVSRLRYCGMPLFFSKHERYVFRYLKILSLMILVVLLMAYQRWLLFPAMLIFISIGLVNGVIQKIRKVELQNVDENCSEIED